MQTTQTKTSLVNATGRTVLPGEVYYVSDRYPSLLVYWSTPRGRPVIVDSEADPDQEVHVLFAGLTP